jgi:hypothetical protein
LSPGCCRASSASRAARSSNSLPHGDVSGAGRSIDREPPIVAVGPRRSRASARSARRAVALAALVATPTTTTRKCAPPASKRRNIGDPRGPQAVAQSRHQRVRVVEALHRFGRAAVPSLMAYEQIHPADRARWRNCSA